MRLPVLRLALGVSALTLALASSNAAHAQYLVNPAGGTLLFSGNSASVANPGGGTSFDDNVVAGRALGFTLSYFGTAHTTVDVAVNGDLNFSGNGAFSNGALPTTVPRIDALWDDLFVFSGNPNTIVEKTGAGFYSTTWEVNTISQQNATQMQRFQIVLFGAPTTISGFNFQANDIAFVYNTLQQTFQNGDATIGLDKGDSATSVLLPNSPPAGGFYTTAQATTGPSAVPFFPASNQFVLFRSNGQGSYTSSIQTAQIGSAAGPEPGSLALIGMGVMVIGARVIRRRRRTAAAV